LLLLLVQLQFLPYHSMFITWTHRLALLADLILIWWLWRRILSGRETDNPPSFWRMFIKNAFGLALSVSVILFATLSATIPNEWQENHFTRLDQLMVPVSVHGLVFNSPIDDTSGRRWLPFSSTLVLSGLNIYEALKIDDPDKVKGRDYIFRTRGRDLTGAIFDLAILPKVDFAHANLQNARFNQAQLQGGLFDGANLQRAELFGAQLQNASLSHAQLQGARLEFVQLQGAVLSFAHLQGSVLDGAHLQGASLDLAELQGASLRNTQGDACVCAVAGRDTRSSVAPRGSTQRRTLARRVAGTRKTIGRIATSATSGRIAGTGYPYCDRSLGCIPLARRLRCRSTRRSQTSTRNGPMAAGLDEEWKHGRTVERQRLSRFAREDGAYPSRTAA
jgi:uncharacterized protein YjbI with pentapeptide repeats